MTRDKLRKRWPWLTDDDLEFIEDVPQVEAFIDEDDDELVPALIRLHEVLREAARSVRAAGEVPATRAYTRSGLATTSLKVETDRR